MTTTTRDPSHITTQQRIETGWDLPNIRGPVCWLAIDNVSQSTPAFVGSLTTGNETPGNDTPRPIKRKHPVDGLNWAITHIVDIDQRRDFLDILTTWSPGRKKDEPALINAKLWHHFKDNLFKQWDGSWVTKDTGEHSDTPGFWARAWLGAVARDAHTLRVTQAASCGKRTIFGMFRELSSNGWGPVTTEVTRWRCKSWTCPDCSQRLQARMGQRLSSALQVISRKRNHDRPFFLTLTLDPKQVKAKYPHLEGRHLEVLSWRIIRQNWKRLARVLRREYGPHHYSLRIEAHRNGWAHLHVILISEGLRAQYTVSPRIAGMHTARIKESAVHAGFGHIADIQLVRHPRDVSYYMTKAATASAPGLEAIAREVTKAKQVRGHLIPRNVRTIEQSRGFWGMVESYGWSDPTQDNPVHIAPRAYSTLGFSGLSLDAFIHQNELLPHKMRREWSTGARVLESLLAAYVDPDDPPL